MNISTVIGKPVLSPQGETLGYVKTAYLDRNLSSLSSLACIDEEEEEFYLPARAVAAIGDAVIAKKTLRTSPVGILCPIGSAAYSSDGRFLGAVADYILDGERSELILRGDETELHIPAMRVAVGERAIVYPDAAPRKAPRKPALPRPKRDPPALSAPDLPVASAGTDADAPSEPADRFSLLGKRVKRDLLDAYGTPIARAGDTVTLSMIGTARRNNLLLRLAMNTLTNLP